MTIRKLKELIENLPDDMRIYADDGSNGMFSDNNEFLTFVTSGVDENMCVLQTREDFDTSDELEAWCEYANENNMDEQDFWIEFSERGYVPADFSPHGMVDEEREAWADKNLRNYGLI